MNPTFDIAHYALLMIGISIAMLAASFALDCVFKALDKKVWKGCKNHTQWATFLLGGPILWALIYFSTRNIESKVDVTYKK